MSLLFLLCCAVVHSSPSTIIQLFPNLFLLPHRGPVLLLALVVLLLFLFVKRLLPPASPSPAFSLLIALAWLLRSNSHPSIPYASFPFSFLFNLPFLDFPSCYEALVSGCCASHGHGLRGGGSSSSCQPPNRAKAPPNLPLTSPPNTQPAPTHHLLPSFSLLTTRSSSTVVKKKKKNKK